MIHKENEATKFVSYQTESYDEAKAIIVNWIYYANDYFNRHENIVRIFALLFILISKNYNQLKS